ncbi:hypothetical protein HaLaN_22835 [Haematococcus lacustris]|uniref:Uncharacterized protein n=1 Tax=Haematococcus lacustris TaxID=44745 RepID=A0A699ZQI6_HAELA|nr:hypothetical protein HaLaN_22835 [Haematococcus lacustris]
MSISCRPLTHSACMIMVMHGQMSSDVSALHCLNGAGTGKAPPMPGTPWDQMSYGIKSLSAFLIPAYYPRQENKKLRVIEDEKKVQVVGPLAASNNCGGHLAGAVLPTCPADMGQNHMGPERWSLIKGSFGNGCHWCSPMAAHGVELWWLVHNSTLPCVQVALLCFVAQPG